MNSGPNHVKAPGMLGILGLSIVLFSACSDQNPTITRPHRIRTDVDAPALNASEAQRFGMSKQAPKQQVSPDELFDWTMPDGWQKQPSSQYRLINLKVGEVECYLTNVVQGEAVLNINRWRRQMGQAALDEAAIEELKGASLLGREGYRMDVSGSYAGMNGKALDDARMLTVYADFPGFAMTVKMVGPREAVEAQTANFEVFTNSVAFKQDLAGRIAQEDEHAGHNHPQGEGHANGTANGPLAWDVPSGWEDAGARQMRHVTFTMAENPGVECYITLLPGQAGSVLDNINRWAKQVGQPALSQADVDGLPSIELLGKPAAVLEGYAAESALIATQMALPGGVMFVKLSGSPDGVRAQKDNFIAFCASLRNE